MSLSNRMMFRGGQVMFVIGCLMSIYDYFNPPNLTILSGHIPLTALCLGIGLMVIGVGETIIGRKV